MNFPQQQPIDYNQIAQLVARYIKPQQGGASVPVSTLTQGGAWSPAVGNALQGWQGSLVNQQPHSALGTMGTTSGTGTGMLGLINGTAPIYQTLGLSGASQPPISQGLQDQWNQAKASSVQPASYGPNSVNDPSAMSTSDLLSNSSGDAAGAASGAASGGGGWFSSLLGAL